MVELKTLRVPLMSAEHFRQRDLPLRRDVVRVCARQVHVLLPR